MQKKKKKNILDKRSPYKSFSQLCVKITRLERNAFESSVVEVAIMRWVELEERVDQCRCTFFGLKNWIWKLHWYRNFVYHSHIRYIRFDS